MNRRINLKVLVPLVLVVLVVSLGLWFWYQYGFISVATDGLANSSIEIISADNKSSSLKASGPQTRKLVKKGMHNVFVSKDGSSYFVAINVRGFFKESSVKPTLEKERKRSFVGDNPLPCTTYINQTLFSYECQGGTDSLVAHKPSVGTQATYTQPEKITQGEVAGVMNINNNLLVVGKPVFVDSDPLYYAYTPASNGMYQGIKLSGIDATKNYTAKPYKTGFILYTDDFDTFYYFASPQSNPEVINIPKPSDESLQPVSIEVNGSRIVVLYTNNKDGAVADIHDSKDIRGIKNTLVVYGGGQTTTVDINNTQIAQAFPCGKSLLCLWSGGNAKVYRLQGNKAEPISEVFGIEGLSVSGETLYINRSKQIIAYKPETGSGYNIYSLGDYTLCGSQGWSGGQVVCLISPNNKKSALLIDERQELNDNLDKKILVLANNPAVASYSVYGNNVVVSPESGAAIYNSSLRSYIYDPAYVKKQVAAINQAVTDAGIDRALYSINIIGN